VTIRGPIKGVAAAWIILMSMLPVTVRVFIGHDTDFRRGSLEKTISQELQVNFLVPRRERRPEDRQYVELRSFEGNIENICKAYKELMGCGVTIPKRIASAADKLHMLGLDFAQPAALPKFSRKSSSQAELLAASLRAQLPSYIPAMPLYSPLYSPFGYPYSYPFPGIVPPFAHEHLNCRSELISEEGGVARHVNRSHRRNTSRQQNCRHMSEAFGSPCYPSASENRKRVPYGQSENLYDPKYTKELWQRAEAYRMSRQANSEPASYHCDCNCRQTRATQDRRQREEDYDKYLQLASKLEFIERWREKVPVGDIDWEHEHGFFEEPKDIDLLVTGGHQFNCNYPNRSDSVQGRQDFFNWP
jgi:hypothetical protein